MGRLTDHDAVRRARRLAIALVAVVLAACGGPPQPVIFANGGAAVYITPTPDKLPYDPRGARLQAATQQLTQAAGHPISFQIDAALLSEWRSSFEEALISAIENVARDFTELKEKEPKVYEHGAPLLTRIECHYGILKDTGHPKLDAKDHKLVLTGPEHGWSELVPASLVARALREEYDDYVAGAYGSLDPDKVPVSERAAYFAFVTGHHRGTGHHGEQHGDKRTPAEIFASSPRAESILKVLRLAALVSGSDKELAKNMHHWLLGEQSYFGDSYYHAAELVQGAPASSVWHRSEAAWVAWVQKELPSMPPDEQLTVAKGVFVRTNNNDRATGSEYASFAFPGFDKVALGLRVTEDWARAGHPHQYTEGARLTTLMEFIVCPSPLNESGNRSLAPHCDYDWYRLALNGDANKKRVLDAIGTRNDPAFTEAVFLNAHRAKHNDALGAMLELWRALEANPAAWQVGARVIADEHAEVSDKPRLTDEVRRLWRAHPERRGALLYILVQLDRYNNGAVAWNDFAQSFGGAISAGEFAGYLRNGHRAMSLAKILWPALGPGFSRAEPYTRELDGFIANPLTTRYNHNDPQSSVSAVVQLLCEEHNDADLARLHAYFTQRVATHPGERFSDIVEETMPGKCSAHAGRTLPASKRVPPTPAPFGPPLPPKRPRAQDRR